MAQTDSSTSKPIENVSEENPPAKGRPRRRGQGSQQKRAEKFRTTKNKEFDRELQAKIENIKINLGYSAQELFGNRSLSSIIYPPKEIKIETDTIGELCNCIADVLHGACKIPPSFEADENETVAYDSETLMWVTALQLEAKMQRARSNTSFLPSLDHEVNYRVQRTELVLSKALAPLAIYLEQIGKFELEGQLFVPEYSGRDFSYARLFDPQNECISYIRGLHVQEPGVLMPNYGPDGRRLYMRPIVDQQQLIERQIVLESGSLNPRFLENPNDFQWFGAVEFVPGAAPQQPLDFNLITTRYVDLQARVSKKLANVLVDVDFQAKGLESQIVYCENGEGCVTAWSPRRVRSDAIEIGAILKLGAKIDSFSHRENCAISATVDRAAGIQMLATVLTKKIR